MPNRHPSSLFEETSWPTFLALSTLVMAVVISFLDPESTQDLQEFQKPFVWIFQIGLLLALMQLVQLGLQKHRISAEWPILVKLIVSGCLGAALFVPMSVWLDLMLGLDDLNLGATQSVYALFWEELGYVCPPAVITWLGLNRLRMGHAFMPSQKVADQQNPVLHTPNLQTGATDEAVEPDTESSAVRRPSFLELVPAHLGEDLVALSAELHYTRVYTTRGQALIFFAFGRAVEELATSGHKGFQVHRSHWVAQSHILPFKRTSSRAYLETDTGLKFPISRRRRSELTQSS